MMKIINYKVQCPVCKTIIEGKIPDMIENIDVVHDPEYIEVDGVSCIDGTRWHKLELTSIIGTIIHVTPLRLALYVSNKSS